MRIRMGGIFALSLILGMAQGILAATEQTIRIQLPAPDLSIGADGYVDVRLAGGLFPADAGDPDLPWIPVKIEIPADQELDRWEWRVESSERLHVGHAPRPALLDRPGSEGGPAEVDPSPRYYRPEGQSYPESSIRFQGMQRAAGREVAAFLVSPLVWNATDLSIHGSRAGSLVYQLRPRSVSRDRVIPRSERLGTELRSPLTGPLLSLDLEASRVSAPDLNDGPYEYVVVTTEALAPSFQPLVDWKLKSGVATTMRTLEWIYANYPGGADGPERIRLFLRDAYQYWGTASVLIGGDPVDVPIRYAKSWAWRTTQGGVDIATDYYYACLDGDWNANGNGTFGEGLRNGVNDVSDETDLVPELHVGRLSVREPEEVASYLQKYFRYVKTPVVDEYLQRFLCLAEVLFDSGWKPGNCDVCDTCEPGDLCARSDGATDAQTVIDTVSASSRGAFWSFTELYERDYWWIERGSPNARKLDFPSAIAALNQGVNVVFHMGHGDRDRWAIGVDRIEAAHLFALTNGTRVSGMAYTINCNSAAVDYDCSAEGWTLAPNGGGLIYIGSTNLDFPVAARRLQNEFFSRWPGDGRLTPGDAFFESADEFSTLVGETDNVARFLMYSVIFIGDPDMQMWSALPQTLSVSHPASVALDAGSYAVDVQLEGAPLAGARVALFKEDDVVLAGITGVDGSVVLPFQPTSRGSFNVTVTHANALPYEGSANVAAATAEFLILTGYSIQDAVDEALGTSGNGNGRLDLGETVTLGLDYANRGSESASNVVVRLETTGPANGVEVELLSDEASVGDVPAGGSSTLANAFRLKVTESIPAVAAGQVALPLEIIWQVAGSDRAQALEPALHAHDSDFVLWQGTPIDETDGDQQPEVDENWNWNFNFYNRGSGDAARMRVRIESTVPQWVSFRRDSAPLISDPLRADHFVLADPFAFTINAANTLNFDLTVEDTLYTPPRELFAQRIDLSPPAPPDSVEALPGLQNVLISWEPRTERDFWSYRIERSPAPGGSFEPIGEGFVDHGAFYSDDGLPPLTPYVYRIASVDLSGNVSPFSPEILTSTSPGALEGWPAPLEEDPKQYCAPTIENLNQWGGYEVFSGGDVLYAFTADGGDYVDGDDAPATRGKMFDKSTFYHVWSKPAVVDLDGDGDMEIVGIARNNGSTNPPEAGEVFALDAAGRTLWQQNVTVRPVTSSPAIGNVDDDPQMEILFLGGKWLYCFNHDGTPLVPNSGGVLLNLPETTQQWYLFGSVALGNFEVDTVGNTDPDEIAFVTDPKPDAASSKLWIVNGKQLQAGGGPPLYGTNVTPFPITWASEGGSSSEYSNSSPAVADVDGDGKPELLVTTRYGCWYVDPDFPSDRTRWYRQSSFNGSPLAVTSTILNGSPALGDVDGDQDLDVAYGWSKGRLYVLDALTGTPLPGFGTTVVPYKTVGSELAQLGSPIMADLDGDGAPEVIVGDNLGKVYALRKDGTMMPGFPYALSGQFGPGLAAWDIDRNGHPNLIITAAQNPSVIVLDFPAADFNDLDPLANPWPQFRHDGRNTGNMANDVIVPIGLAAPLLTARGGLEVELVWSSDLVFQQFEVWRFQEDRVDGLLAASLLPEEARHDEGGYRFVDQAPGAGLWRYMVVGISDAGERIESGQGSIELSAGALRFALHAAQPNPFGGSTRLTFEAPRAMKVELRVLDPAGRLVRRVFDGGVVAGRHNFLWDGRDDRGHPLGSGVYFVEARADGTESLKEKVVLLK